MEVVYETVVRMITMQHSGSHHDETMIGPIREVMNRDWRSEITHAYRGGNSCAGWMRQLALSMPLGSRYFTHSPVGIGALLCGDSVGLSCPVFVFLSSFVVFLSWA